jgi:Family of unknown function (DUF5678)
MPILLDDKLLVKGRVWISGAPSRHMLYCYPMPKDWTHLAQRYPGKWVALADDETTVIASGDSAKEALKAATAQSPSPFLYRVPESLDAFVGYEIRV